MKKFMVSFAGLGGLILAASTATAQPAPDPADSTEHGAEHAQPATPAEPAAPAEPALPAEPAAEAAVTAAADLTETDIDSFAKATVALQEIQADTAIAPEQKQTAMVAAVTEAGLDPAKYNAIGRAAQSDAELRTKVQTAMSKYTGPRPSEG